MPTGTRVHDCVDKLKREGREEGSAIAICQSSTHQGYASGKPLKKLRKALVHPKLGCSKILRGRCRCLQCKGH